MVERTGPTSAGSDKLTNVGRGAELLREALATEGFEQLDPLRSAEELHVIDDRTNGRRFDVRVASTDGAWLVVIWTTATDLAAVESVTVHARPRVFDGRPGGIVIVLNGPSSVGKSSLMRAFARRSPTPFACFDEPWLGRLPADYLAWPETLGPAIDGALEGIATAARLGNQFIVSAAGISQARFRAALADVPVVFVGLDASLDELVRRQLTQVDKFGGLAEESIGIHAGWDYDLRIDTEACAPDRGAELLSDHIAQLPA